MNTTITILKDIQLRPNSHIFYRRSSQLVYDNRSPRDKKQHQLLFQQGDRYGTVGDCCDYISHEQLLELEQQGFVRINGRVKR
ncbi:MAG TPA: hypothetical protein VJS44_14075 [Pyrinomonadaceae bacterium]|nr:hypothetical protein [Pyrinomonadaceae bacterium]